MLLIAAIIFATSYLFGVLIGIQVERGKVVETRSVGWVIFLSPFLVYHFMKDIWHKLEKTGVFSK